MTECVGVCSRVCEHVCLRVDECVSICRYHRYDEMCYENE